MADEDQERFEDYIELERYIEELQTGKVAHPPTDLTPEQARIYQMAALFRSASPENAEPRSAFADALKAQLLDARKQQAHVSEPTKEQQNVPTPPIQTPPTSINSPTTSAKRPVRFFSRRNLLTGGAVAAASLVIGVGAEHVIDQRIAANDKDTSPTQPPSTHLAIDSTISTRWQFVTTLAELGQEAIRFVSDAVIGYVIRDAAQSEQIIALSAACTHMGCIVQWNDADHSFHCPCHSAFFAANGTHIRLNYRYALPPLPKLNTKVEDGKVYVEVP